MSVTGNHAHDETLSSNLSQVSNVGESPVIASCALCGRELQDDDHKTSLWAGSYVHDDCIEFD